MRRGEIWQVDIPYSSGHAQAGSRPALVIQGDVAITALPTVLIMPFTSTLGAQRFHGTLLVQPSAENGLRFPSVALCFQVRALDKHDFLRRLGILEEQTLQDIADLLQNLVT